MEKINLGIVFGGMSTEHEVSIMSGISVIENLDKSKYNIYNIYINKIGEWYEYNYTGKDLKLGEEIKNITLIENPYNYIKQFDCIFPVLHGAYGEDGAIQGLFELSKIPYVGCGVLSSSVGMDKVYTKMIFEKANIKQTKHITVIKEGSDYILLDDKLNHCKKKIEEICDVIEKEINYPAFIKPSNSGSSIGVNKAKSKKDLIQFIDYASKFDQKVIIEKGINGREIECSILGHRDVEASVVGEIKLGDEFYSYNDKYVDGKSIPVIPAQIAEEKANEIRKIAMKAFKAIDGKGFSRVDFFLENETEEIYLNEINTIPGFTTISMYPKLWEASGLSYSKLLEKLIDIAMK